MRYGWRGKIGLIHPAPGLSAEVEFHRMAPQGVAILSTRIPLEKVTPEGLEKMGSCIEQAALLLAQAKPDIIAFGCTTGSLIKGIGYDKEIIRRIKNNSNVPAVTTSTAVIDSLKFFKARRIAISTPYYCDELNQREKAFIEASGFEVVSIKALQPPSPEDIEKPHTQSVLSEEMYRLAKEAFDEKAEVVFISCSGLGLIDIIEYLEADVRRPVITSNQATMWSALRKIGINDKINGLGLLFKT